MQLTRTLFTLALAAVAAADNCTPGLAYCGSSLLGKGSFPATPILCLNVLKSTSMSAKPIANLLG